MLKRFYTKYVKQKLFYRILLCYTLIFVVMTTALAAILMRAYTQSYFDDIDLKTQAQVQNTQKLLDEKINSVQLLFQELYYYKNPYAGLSDFSGIFTLLSETETSASAHTRLRQLKTMDNYLQHCLFLDNDIEDVSMLSTENGAFYSASATSYRAAASALALDVLTEQSARSDQIITLIPTFQTNPSPRSEHSVFSVAARVRSTDLSRNIGVMLVNYTTNILQAPASSDEGYELIDILIFTEDGSVVFDSQGLYDAGEHAWFSHLAPDRTVRSTVTDGLHISSVASIRHGYVIAGVTQIAQMNSALLPFRVLIFLLLAVSIGVAVALFYSVITRFNGRVQILTDTIRQVQEGDLGARVPLDGHMDEISLISQSFNGMCDNLDYYIRRSSSLELQRKDAELKQTSAELYALQSQINPHFLYNTLDAIRTQALVQRAPDVAEMVLVLATLFRISIRREMIVSIADELEYCQSYLKLYALRYGDLLSFGFDVDPQIRPYSIPKLLLQPLIENAVVHGIDPLREGNVIQVRGRMAGSDIEILICDNGNGMDEQQLTALRTELAQQTGRPGAHIGISNVNQRIKLIYGTAYGVSIRSIRGAGTEIRVQIPARDVEEMKRYV